MEEEDAHHRNERLSGLGDIQLKAKHFISYQGRKQIALTLGVRLPTGKVPKVTAASFLSHHEAEVLGLDVPYHTHLSLGTGTVDPLLGMEMLYRLEHGWMFFSSLDLSLPLYENPYHYRTSPQGILRLAPAYRLRDQYFIASFSLESFYAARDRFDGEDLQGNYGRVEGTFWVPNTGRWELAWAPSILWGMTDQLTLNLQIRIPFYTRIREDTKKRDVQLTEPLGLFLGLSWNIRGDE